MKRVMVWIAVALFVCFLGGETLGADKAVKIGVLDMQKLQQKSKKFLKIRDELKVRFETLQKKLDQEKEELIRLEEELKKQSMMLSLDAREDKQRELDKKRRHYKYSYEDYTQEMKEDEVEATRKVGKDIEKVVEKIAQSEGYTIILERGMVGLVYFDNPIDLTDQVIKAYDMVK